jgi:hypothetical protein
MPGNKCSNCSAYNFECKYEEAAKVCVQRRVHTLSEKRGPPKRVRKMFQDLFILSVKVCGSLESRLEKMENLL